MISLIKLIILMNYFKIIQLNLKLKIITCFGVKFPWSINETLLISKDDVLALFLKEKKSKKKKSLKCCESAEQIFSRWYCKFKVKHNFHLFTPIFVGTNSQTSTTLIGSKNFPHFTSFYCWVLRLYIVSLR